MVVPLHFFFDQHIPFPVAQGLRRRGVDVLTAQEAERCGLPDAEQIIFAGQAGRVLVTFDADFLALAAGGVRHAVLEPAEMRDHIEFL